MSIISVITFLSVSGGLIALPGRTVVRTRTAGFDPGIFLPSRICNDKGEWVREVMNGLVDEERPEFSTI